MTLVVDALEEDGCATCEKLSTDGTRAIRHMNKSGVLDGIMMLTKRWDSVIEKQGDY